MHAILADLALEKEATWLCNSKTKQETGGSGLTGVTAASKDNKSISWARSASSGQYPGSMVMSALVQTLVQRNGTDKPILLDGLPNEVPASAEETYCNFAEELFSTLYAKVDRYAAQYNM
ncbi:hypothetical protein LZ554_003223 [Drepanopeziza brunnea f. sp. 'monogermtubi']|nr:hypothetical protein LZ554_003223 [Drepanopeziza brunnea f. sp. 'monogermtubi']